MRAPTLLCVTLATVWLVVTAHHGDMDGGGGGMGEKLKAKLDSNGKGIARLATRIINSLDKLQERSDNKEKADRKSKGMLNKLDRWFGGHCQDSQFACQDTTQGECVSLLLCCDGVNDCPNGEDEADEICKQRFNEGDTWSGLFEFYTCNNEILTDVKFRLDKVTKKEGNTGTADISGMLFWVDETRPHVKMYEQLPYKGHYHFGSRMGEFRIQYSGQNYLEKLYFLPGDDNTLHYDIYTANTNEMCGRAYMHYDH